jgi:pimeloyl-ACP methyl ester carboxylesterase
MRSIDIDFDVSAATGLEAGTIVAGTLHLPEPLIDGEPVDLLFCLHGGGYRRAYWHPPFGQDDTYSFARFFTDRGKAVLAIDLLGMGDSSRPQPETQLNRMKIAAASASALQEATAGLRDGRWAKSGAISVTGVGHSIGGMMITTQATAHKGFDRLGVFGWANLPMVLGDADPAMLAATIPAEGYLDTPKEQMRRLFFMPDVPIDVVQADEAIRSSTPSCLGRDALTPGIVHAASANIAVPVFVLQSIVDTSPDPWGEPAYFKDSTDVTLSVLADAAHCQNFATTRVQHWARFNRWIDSRPG